MNSAHVQVSEIVLNGILLFLF